MRPATPSQGGIKSLLAKILKKIWLPLLILALAGASGYFYLQYRDAQNKLSNPQEVANAALQETLEKVGKLILLPSDESPTLATVTDAEKLKTQAFFTNTKNGDKVLIYTKNKLAILYDPIGNKIVAVGTVNLSNTTTGE